MERIPRSDIHIQGDDSIHSWFGLTYSNYLVLNRAILQSMPGEWQERFVKCLIELDNAYTHVDFPNNYTVNARGEDGRFIKDPIPHYNRGRTYIEPKFESSKED